MIRSHLAVKKAVSRKFYYMSDTKIEELKKICLKHINIMLAFTLPISMI